MPTFLDVEIQSLHHATGFLKTASFFHVVDSLELIPEEKKMTTKVFDHADL